MQKYIGVKIVGAVPMTLGDYNKSKGWTIPADEDPNRKGYQVAHSDDYVSWCPKEQFEEANRPCDAMSFGHALEALKKGLKVCRAGWNGKGMYVAIQPGTMIMAEQARGGVAKCIAEEYGERLMKDDERLITICPHIDMRAADGTCVVGWLASQTDMLADDWQIVE